MSTSGWAGSRAPWRQGEAIDFDTVSPAKLDQFDYAVTTAAAYQSTPPENMRPVASDRDFWKQAGISMKAVSFPTGREALEALLVDSDSPYRAGSGRIPPNEPTDVISVVDALASFLR
jgi:hypothetical protein